MGAKDQKAVFLLVSVAVGSDSGSGRNATGKIP